MSEEKRMTGYPSIDKPWLKYYTEEAIHAPMPEQTMYQYLWENNRVHLSDIAMRFYGTKIS
jgi:long-chain acyl-CoA synthetase